MKGATLRRRGPGARRRRAAPPSRWLVASFGALTALLVLSMVAQAVPLEPIDRVPPLNPPPFSAPADGFRWTVPSRFGQRDASGLIDYHWDPITRTYNHDYVHPSAYPVNVNGCQTADDFENGPTSNNYVWEEVTSAGALVRNLREGQTNACSFRYEGWSSQGDRLVRLTVYDGVNPDNTPRVVFGPFTRTVTIRDYLIVSIGDSYASGEGNPDIPQQVHLTPILPIGDFIGSVDPAARWEEERCHRSSYAGPAQAALALELESAKTSVTFISLACSGATINTPTYDGDDPNKPQGTGILGTYRGAAPGEGVGYSEAERLPAQLDALHELVGDRQIDALIISGGGNDIGFGNIASLCVLNGRCYAKLVNDNFVPDDDGRPLSAVVADKIAELPARYGLVADKIYDASSPWQMDVANVLVTEYPDPTKTDGGSYCPSILYDILGWPADMTAAEATWAANEVLIPLNGALQTAVTTQRQSDRNWYYVGGIRAAFAAGHGYCASDNWIRTATESMYMQGPFPWLTGASIPAAIVTTLTKGATKGTLHPTIDGHQVYKTHILEALHAALLPSTTPAPSAPTFSVTKSLGGVASRAGTGGWLTGSCTGTSCSSDRAVLTVAAYDSVAIRGASLEIDGSAINTVNGNLQCPAGMACTGGLSTDGKTYTWTFSITQEGIYRLQFAARGDDDQLGTLDHEVRVDLTDPTATLAPPSPEANGWYRGPLELTVVGQDSSAGSGFAKVEYAIDGGATSFASLGQLITLGEGNHTVTYQAIDLAGRRGSPQTFTANVDATPPALECGSADGEWHAADVSISCTASDNRTNLDSGLVDQADASFSLATSVQAGTETADAATSSHEVCDQVGNCATAGPITGNRVDKKAPTIALTSPATGSVQLGQVVNAVYACQDGGSGVASCAGTTANGSPIDTTSVGSKAFEVSATDDVGNSATRLVTYSVTFKVCLLYDEAKAYKRGSVAPIRLQLCDAGDSNVSAVAITVTATGVKKVDANAVTALAEDAGNANPDGNFRYDEALGGYVYNLSTRGMTTGTYEMTYTVSDDPVTHTARFSVR